MRCSWGHKHREVLGGATFVRETEEVYCVWQNTLDPRDDRVEIELDFFAKGEKGRIRSSSPTMSVESNA